MGSCLVGDARTANDGLPTAILVGLAHYLGMGDGEKGR